MNTLSENPIDKFTNVKSAYETIRKILIDARNSVYRSINFAMVESYFRIGRVIMEEEQKGKDRAEYGQYLISELSKKLTREFGKGFNITNLKYMRQFYVTFQKSHALRDQLSWTHYRLLLKVEREEARNFYMLEAAENGWSTRELERQINSLLFERLALSREKEEVLDIAKRGQQITKPSDLVKDPYVMEFLGLKENNHIGSL